MEGVRVNAGMSDGRSVVEHVEPCTGAVPAGASAAQEASSATVADDDPSLFHPELSPFRRWAVLLSFVLAASICVMSQLTMTTCLPSILAEFGVSTASGQWLTTSYMLAFGVMVPCSGFFAKRFQSRHIFLGASLVFLVGLAGTFVHSFPALVTVRCIQGLAAGLLSPLMQIVAFRLFPPKRRGFAMGVVAVALTAGPTLGPFIAGICTDLWGWRSVFAGVGVLTLCSLATYPVIRTLSDSTERRACDVASPMLLAVGFTGLLLGASNLGTFSSDLVSGCIQSGLPLLAGALSLVVFAWRQSRLAQPFLDLAPLRDRRFTVGALAAMIIFGTLINTEVFMSIYIQADQGYPSTVAALTLLPGSIVSAFLCPFTGRALDKHGPLVLAAIGFSVLAMSGILASLVELSSPLGYSSFAFALRNFGNGFVLQNLQTWACNLLPGHLVTYGTAIVNTMRQMGGALINATLFALMGAVSPALGEMGGIKLAYIVSTVLVALMGARVMYVLAREQKERARELAPAADLA